MSLRRKIIILFSTLSWIVFAFSGLQGFSFWYGGFVVFLWVALGTWNYHRETTIWYLLNDPKHFFKLYLLLLIFWVFGDLSGQLAGLWSYPVYKSVLDFIWVWAVLYSVAGFTMLEMFYFLGEVFEEPLDFKRLSTSFQHRMVHYTESSLLVIVLTSLVAFPVFKYAGVVEVNEAITAFALITMISWSIFFAVRLRFHFKHWKHLVLLLLLTAVITFILNEVPNVGANEWIYGEAPFLNVYILSIPLWIFFVWYWWISLHLRVWSKLMLDQQKQT